MNACTTGKLANEESIPPSASFSANPKYREFLREHGFTSSAHLFGLPGVVVGGHPDRNVVRVNLGDGPELVVAYLKQEHRVPWKDRAINFLHGFGFVSKSSREAQVLQRLQRAGIGCPEFLATGENDKGKSFLLVKELERTCDLRLYLRDWLRAKKEERMDFARKVGMAVAQVHRAGFDHPDLYSKHVFVHPESQRIYFLDWQRARQLAQLSREQRCRNLAALEASLGPNLATPRERLACLRAYLEESGTPKSSLRKNLILFISEILFWKKRFLKRRRIRELWQPPRQQDPQNLVWLDGEALCVTPQYAKELRGQIPDWLRQAAPTGSEGRRVVRPGGIGHGILVRRSSLRPFSWMRSWLVRRPFSSPEVAGAEMVFRLERSGIPVPRLLAFGQWQTAPWKTESFLFTESWDDSEGLFSWLGKKSPSCLTPEHLKLRRRVLRETGVLLRRLHEATCFVSPRNMLPGACPDQILVVRSQVTDSQVGVKNVGGLCRKRRFRGIRAQRDLRRLTRELGKRGCSRTDLLRFLLSYHSDNRPARVGKVLRMVLAGKVSREDGK